MWVLNLALVLLWSGTGTDASVPQVIYYYSQWSIWARRYCANEFFTKFEGTTHIQYSFHSPDASCEIVTNDIDADLGGEWWLPGCEAICPGEPADRASRSKDRANIGCLRKIQKETDIKIGISLGGWTLSKYFSGCVKDSAKRTKMVNSIVEQTKEYGWDFVDIDWEYPNGGGLDANADGSFGLPEDWSNFKLLVNELRSKFASQGLSHIGISGAFGQNPNLLLGTGKYTNPTPMKWLCDNLDYVSLMSYDLMGGWGAPTGWPAPLYHDPAAPYDSADKLTIEWQLKTWKAACGANFNKVILGLPAYAKSWRSVPAGPLGSGLYENCSYTGTGPQDYAGLPCLGDGSFKDTSGTLEVWDIEAMYVNDSRCKNYYHTVARQDWVYCKGVMYGENKGEDIWFAYDGPEVMYDKVKYAKDMGVGGWMFWEAAYTALGQDTQYQTMVSSKANALKRDRTSFKTDYFWTDYENACHDAWNGRPLATPSRGERYPAGGSVSTPSPIGSTTTRPATTKPPAGSGAPKCDEVTSASVSDGSVDSSCVSSFCTLACNTFMSGVCAGSSSPGTCLNNEISNIPPAGSNGIRCSFATA